MAKQNAVNLPPLAGEPGNLKGFTLIVVNTSAGKDSLATLIAVAERARLDGVLDRVVAVHATFPEEWPGTVDLARRQAEALGVFRFEVVQREKDGVPDSLLAYVERRQKWPSNKARFCTSDFKRAPVDKVITRLEPGPLGWVLNVLGLRAQESPARAKRAAFEVSLRRSNSRRQVFDWHPILNWSEEQVWQVIQEAGAEVHPAYSQGFRRLSCVFCVFAPKAQLIAAGRLNPRLLAEYARVERSIGHLFRQDLSIAAVHDTVAAEVKR